MSMTDPDEILARDLTRWLIERTHGDPTTAVTALTEVLAEFIKASSNPTNARKNITEYLDRFLEVPNRFVMSDTKQ